MALPTILPPDVNATIGAKSNYNSNALKPSGFDKFLNTASYTAQTFGPLAYATTNASTGNVNSTSSQIVGAAINATASQNTSYSGGMSFGTTSSPTPATGVMVGAPGSSGSSSMGGLSSNVESILSDTAASQAYLLGIQMQMGEQQTMFTSVSNAINVRDSMKKMVINNFKV
jgi:hypothetical protein